MRARIESAPTYLRGSRYARREQSRINHNFLEHLYGTAEALVFQGIGDDGEAQVNFM
jgi:hypothetical protein